jgi:uncharacterized protein YerC
MSKYKVKESVVDKIGELMFEIFGKENNKDNFILALNDVLSPVERLMVGKRLLVMYMVYLGVRYDVICDVVKVSRATISKFAFLLDKSNNIKHTLSIISSKNKARLTINELLSSILEPGVSLGSWKSAWKLKQRIIEQKEQGF